METSGKRRSLSIETKISIIKAVEENVRPKNEIAAEYGIPANSLSTIIKMAPTLKAIWGQGGCGKRKRRRLSQYPELDHQVVLWYLDCSDSQKINGPAIKKKAQELAGKLGLTEFKATEGWLDRFKKRHGIRCRPNSYDCNPDRDLYHQVALGFPGLTRDFYPPSQKNPVGLGQNYIINQEPEDSDSPLEEGTSYDHDENQASNVVSSPTAEINFPEMETSGKRKSLSIETKISIIKAVEENVRPKNEIAAEYGIPANSLSNIIKMAPTLKAIWGQGGCGKRKRQRLSQYPELDHQVVHWYLDCSESQKINGPAIKKKAQELAGKLGLTEFKATDGWLDRFKKRHGIKCRPNSYDGNKNRDFYHRVTAGFGGLTSGFYPPSQNSPVDLDQNYIKQEPEDSDSAPEEGTSYMHENLASNLTSPPTAKIKFPRMEIFGKRKSLLISPPSQNSQVDLCQHMKQGSEDSDSPAEEGTQYVHDENLVSNVVSPTYLLTNDADALASLRAVKNYMEVKTPRLPDGILAAFKVLEDDILSVGNDRETLDRDTRKAQIDVFLRCNEK